MRPSYFHRIRTAAVLLAGALGLAALAVPFLLSEPANAQRSDKGVFPQCPTPPDTINVYLQSNYSDWPYGSSHSVTPTLESYVSGVAMGELGPTVPLGTYAGQFWDDEVIKAQAVAARTWGAYFCKKHDGSSPENPLLPDGRIGLYDGQPDQEYRPYDVDFNNYPDEKARFQTVSRWTAGIYITWDGLLVQWPYQGRMLDAEYRQDVGNPTCSWRSGDDRDGCLYASKPVTGYEFLASVNSPYNVVSNTVSVRDGPGWSQLASQGWMNTPDKVTYGGHGHGYQALLDQYYTGMYLQNQAYTTTQQVVIPTTFSGKFYNTGHNISACPGKLQPAYSGTTPRIDYDWGTAAPQPGVTQDYFCADWRTTAQFDANDWYTFYILADDGYRLYVDDTPIMENWAEQASPVLESVSAYLPAGGHRVRMEYFKKTGTGVARLAWLPGTGMIGSYYNKVIDMTGDITDTAVMERPDVPIRFDWYIYSSLDIYTQKETDLTRMNDEGFSIRWLGNIYVDACRNVTFHARSDDGIYLRVFLPKGGGGGTEPLTIINGWKIQSPTDYFNVEYLCAGTYPLEARYYENTGWAVIRIWWEQ